MLLHNRILHTSYLRLKDVILMVELKEKKMMKSKYGHFTNFMTFTTSLYSPRYILYRNYRSRFY